MNKRKLEAYEKELLQERERIVKALNRNEDEFGDSGMSRTAEFEETAKMDRDNDYISGILSTEAKILKEIDAALKRIKEGMYGLCIDTEKEISEDRLEVMPWAPRCFEAQETYERKKRTGEL